MITRLVCPDGHRSFFASRSEPTEAEIDKHMTCLVFECGKKLEREGGTPPAGSPTSNVQKF